MLDLTRDRLDEYVQPDPELNWQGQKPGAASPADFGPLPTGFDPHHLTAKMIDGRLWIDDETA